MSTTNRIVLLDGKGDELFSGDSLLSDPPPAPAVARVDPLPESEEGTPPVDADEAIPPTLRSSVLVRAREPVSRPIIVDEATPSKNDAGHRAA